MYARTPKQKYRPTVESGFWAERWTVLLGIGVLAVIVVLLYAAYQFRLSPTGPYRSEYHGKIIDKWAKYSESEEGSRPGFTFLIEQDDGQRFPVAVSSEIYQKGKVGMRIKKTEAGGVELMVEERDTQKGLKY